MIVIKGEVMISEDKPIVCVSILLDTMEVHSKVFNLDDADKFTKEEIYEAYLKSKPYSSTGKIIEESSVQKFTVKINGVKL